MSLLFEKLKALSFSSSYITWKKLLRDLGNNSNYFHMNNNGIQMAISIRKTVLVYYDYYYYCHCVTKARLAT